jgi:hypothetical protein
MAQMRSRLVLSACATALLLFAAGGVHAADEWMWPTPQVFSASSGSYALRTLPPPPSKSLPGPSPFGRAQAVLFKPGADGKDVAIWKRELVNTPYRAVVSDDGKFVVTFDTWGRVGFAHSLVIYGEQGRLIADYELDALFPRDEITERVPHSTSSRWWHRDSITTFTEPGDELVVTLKWGRVLRVALATGKVIAREP